MAWYDKYCNKIAKNGDFWLNTETDRLYESAQKAIHPKNTHSVRWYEYYYDDDLEKYVRVTNRMKTSRKMIWLPKSRAEELNPEYFI